MATTMRSGPKPVIDEERFIPQSIKESRELIRALVARGTPLPKARTIVGTLQDLERPYSRAFSVTMSDYRKELAKLDGPPWERVGSSLIVRRDKGA